MKNEFLIESGNSYHKTMIAIYALMNKGDANLTLPELELLQSMALAAEKYEDEVLNLKTVK